MALLLVLSSQIDVQVMARYRAAGGLVITGKDTYTFMRTVVGYDLGSFFTRHSYEISTAVADVLRKILDPRAA